MTTETESQPVPHTLLVCLNPKCRYSWAPRGAFLPKACPNCTSRKWNNPSHWAPKKNRVNDKERL